jgi:hypothetical protein
MLCVLCCVVYAVWRCMARCKVNENRVRAVMSKMGEVNDRTALRRLSGLFTADLLTDFKKDHASAYDKLTDRERKQLNVEAQRIASAFVSGLENQILEHEF